MRKAFTLIELMIVISVIALITSIVIPRFSKVTDSAKVAKVQGDLANLRTAISMFYAKDGTYPELEKDLELVKGKENMFTDFYSKSKMPKTPAFIENPESREVVEKRNNKGGWLYYKNSGDIYANLKNGTYTNNPDNEVWEEDCSLEDPELPSTSNKNPAYDGIEEYKPGAFYEKGDLIVKDGVVYECTDPRYSNTDPDSLYGFWAWGVVGTVDGSIVAIDSEDRTKKFAIGTTVYYTDTTGNNNPPSGEYMYAPAYGEEAQWHNAHFSDSSDWIPVTDENRDSIVYTTKDTVFYNWNKNYKEGDVVWHKGAMYKASKDVAGKDNTPATTPDAWTKIES